jgi:hypothetical protein
MPASCADKGHALHVQAVLAWRHSTTQHNPGRPLKISITQTPRGVLEKPLPRSYLDHARSAKTRSGHPPGGSFIHCCAFAKEN